VSLEARLSLAGMKKARSDDRAFSVVKFQLAGDAAEPAGARSHVAGLARRGRSANESSCGCADQATRERRASGTARCGTNDGPSGTANKGTTERAILLGGLTASQGKCRGGHN
jgi:hypothetical protein